MLWSAWMKPISRPLSCCGKKPLGIDHVEKNIEADRDQQHEHHDDAVPQDPASVRS